MNQDNVNNGAEGELAETAIDKRIEDLGTILDNVWILICSIMVLLA